MKKFILSILLILLISIPGFAQYGQVGGGISGITLDGNTIVFGSPADSVIFEIPVSAEASFTFETLIGTVFKIFNAAGDTIVINPNGSDASNSAVAGTAVFNYKSRGGHSVIIDSLSAYVSVYDSPVSNVGLMQLGTSADADRFKVDEDGDVTADGSIAASGALSGTTITGTGKISTIVTTKQFELGYDATNLFDITLLDDGHTTFTTIDPDGAEADINFAPDGNVGIKTVAPSTALEVTGRVTASTGFTDGTVLIDGSGNFTGVGTFTFGNGTILNNSTADLLTITEATVDIDGNFTAGTIISDGLITANGAFTSPGIDDNADATAITIDVTTEKVNFSADADVVADFTAGTITSNAIITATTDVAWGGQYLLSEATANNAVVRNTTAGQPASFRFQAADMDGTDNVTLNYDAIGQPGDGNREALIFGYFSAQNSYQMYSFESGTGVNRVLQFGHNGNPQALIINTDNSIVVGFEIIYVPNAASNSGTSVADDGAITVLNTIMRMVGADADALLDTDPAVNDGIADGQIVIIQGTADGNTVTIADNVNTQLAGGVNMTLGDGDVLCLMWDSNYSMWIEQYRADN